MNEITEHGCMDLRGGAGGAVMEARWRGRLYRGRRASFFHRVADRQVWILHFFLCDWRCGWSWSIEMFTITENPLGFSIASTLLFSTIIYLLYLF